MRAVIWDGRRDRRVDVPAFVRIHVGSDDSLMVVCDRCEWTERISIACGSAMKRIEAQRNLGRFCLKHEQCPEPKPKPYRPKWRGRAPLDKYGTKLILVGNRYVRRA